MITHPIGRVFGPGVDRARALCIYFIYRKRKSLPVLPLAASAIGATNKSVSSAAPASSN